MLLALVFMKYTLIETHARYYYTSFYRDTEKSRFLRQTLCSIGCNVSCECDLQVQVVDWMKGQTCGLCGKADGEIKQEFRTPNGFLTKNPVTCAHSWILPAESCKDSSGETWERPQQLWRAEHAPDPAEKLNCSLLPSTECRIKLESVKLEKQAVVYGQESKCFSVQPVLRCLPGCFPVKTTPVTAGFHCIAAGEFTPTLNHHTKWSWSCPYFIAPLCRIQLEEIWGSQRYPWEERRLDGKSWSSPGLQLHDSVCLNTLCNCHFFERHLK